MRSRLVFVRAVVVLGTVLGGLAPSASANDVIPGGASASQAVVAAGGQMITADIPGVLAAQANFTYDLHEEVVAEPEDLVVVEPHEPLEPAKPGDPVDPVFPPLFEAGQALAAAGGQTITADFPGVLAAQADSTYDLHEEVVAEPEDCPRCS